MNRLHMWMAGVTLATLAVGAVVVNTAFADEKLKADVLKIAALEKAGKGDEAKKAGSALAGKVEGTEDLMHLFKPRTKGGLGVGPAGAVAKDGVEMLILDLARDVAPATRLAKEGDHISDAGYNVAALADITRDIKQSWTAKKTQKDWQKWSDEMRDAGLKFAAAAKAKGGQELKTASAKVRASCDGCHSIFR